MNQQSGLSAFERVMKVRSTLMRDPGGHCKIVLPGFGLSPDFEAEGASDEEAAERVLSVREAWERKMGEAE